VAIVFAGLLAGGWIVRTRLFRPAYQIKSLAVLPLRSLDSKEDYLGVGMADAVIRRISQTGQLTVRPTSAVLKYLSDNTDSLAAARQLNVDAVLEGNILHYGDRIRVSVNLLRTPDGASLWTDSFDVSVSDIFAIQDEVAQQVAARLKFRLDSPRPVGNEEPTTSTVAYMYYVKGIYSLDQRGFDPSGKAQICLRRSRSSARQQLQKIRIMPSLMPNSATVMFGRPCSSSRRTRSGLASPEKRSNERRRWIPTSRRAIEQMPFCCGARTRAFQNEAALRELLLAKQLNPGVGDELLAVISEHLGLVHLSDREMKLALDIDPTSRQAQDLPLTLYSLRQP
jgi:TolB-like protein